MHHCQCQGLSLIHILLFFKEFAGNYQDLAHFFTSMKFQSRSVSLETEDRSFKNLQALLETVLDKVKRFSMIYYINDFHILSSCNYSFIMNEAEKLLNVSLQGGQAEAIDSLIDLLSEVTDLSFLKQLSNSLMLKITAGDNQMCIRDRENENQNRRKYGQRSHSKHCAVV